MILGNPKYMTKPWCIKDLFSLSTELGERSRRGPVWPHTAHSAPLGSVSSALKLQGFLQLKKYVWTSEICFLGSCLKQVILVYESLPWNSWHWVMGRPSRHRGWGCGARVHPFVGTSSSGSWSPDYLEKGPVQGLEPQARTLWFKEQGALGVLTCVTSGAKDTLSHIWMPFWYGMIMILGYLQM